MSTMHETLGYCPGQVFQTVANKKDSNPNSKNTIVILGNRIDCMVYTEYGNCYPNCYIIDALMNAEWTLGIEVAACLCEFMPTCNKDTESVIWLTDIINPYQVPVRIYNNGKSFYLCDEESNFKVFQDEKYFICIEKTENDVHLYCYKKPPKKQ